ncbi:hypothetical protein ACRE_055500 [Hapsidospora chrysogenum ATCC 11550]|uniref:Uncharacterized protein n=1 Tax=Hapsidospora chrysogenum (strain ATCC 11550 / CBS 779.69 / DSM 880 / IAM 14645 / JCM 23072 / IMI 49137) TaxID=857340 RepID=A0A086T2U1_HAPC1|nr:hypothetical protein ACRE_055500 [Hapsidospora chrysogenum ATCC 11550]
MLLISVQDSNAQLGELELEGTLLSSLEDGSRAVDDVDASVGIVVGVRIADVVGEDRESGLGARLDAVEGQMHGDILVVGGVVDGTLPDVRALILVTPGDVEERVEVGRRGQGVRHGVRGEELPEVPRGGARGELGVGGELENGDGPLPAVEGAQHGRVKCGRDAVGVALVADHGDGLAHGADPPGVLHQLAVPADAAVGMRRRHLANNVPNVIVKSVKLLHERIRLPVRVVVADGRRGDVLVPVARGAGGDDGDVRVGGVDGLEEEREAVVLVRLPAFLAAGEPVLVADLDVAQGEGLRVAELGAAGAPFGVGGPADELNLVEGVLCESLGNILAQAILAALVRGREQADEVKVERVIGQALYIRFCQQTRHIYHRSAACSREATHSRVKGQGEGVVAVGRIDGRFKLKGVLHPLALSSLTLNLDTAKDNVLLDAAAELSGEDAIITTVHPETARVSLLGDVHTPVAVVDQTDAVLRMQAAVVGRAGAHSHGYGQGLRQRCVEAVEGEVCAVEGRPAREGDGVGLAVLEGAVADELGVDAAVAGVVDVLVEEAVLVAAGGVAAVVLDLDLDRVGVMGRLVRVAGLGALARVVVGGH